MNIEQLARELIRAERLRHVTLGWDAVHDEGHAEFLRAAAACYRMSARSVNKQTEERLGIAQRPPKTWPWEERFWKPKTAKLDLIRAGALYLASEDAETYPAHKSNAHRDYEWIVKDLVAVLVTEPIDLLLAAANGSDSHSAPWRRVEATDYEMMRVMLREVTRVEEVFQADSEPTMHPDGDKLFAAIDMGDGYSFRLILEAIPEDGELIP